jgi:hypothetical protein
MAFEVPDTVTLGALMFVRDAPGVTMVRLASAGKPDGDGEAVGYAGPPVKPGRYRAVRHQADGYSESRRSLAIPWDFEPLGPVPA